MYAPGVSVRPVKAGALAAKRGDGRTAAADLERAVSMMPHPFTGERSQRGFALGLLAGAYEVAGDFTKGPRDL
jgi:hypothetical protein